MDHRPTKSSSATEELNAGVAQRVWDEVWHKGDFSGIDELFDPQFVRHDLDPAQGQGRKQNEEFIRRMRGAFPDLQFHIDDVIAKGDKVVTRYHFEGTHLGDSLGFKATGKRATYTGILIQRFENGKIVEQWTEANLLSLFRQLGLIPDPKK
ncbi:MAG TPA: ester cyclase [Terracidiphilus sp.]|jgi:steroid delta-isomerase-like uncharacterized protein